MLTYGSASSSYDPQAPTNMNLQFLGPAISGFLDKTVPHTSFKSIIFLRLASISFHWDVKCSTLADSGREGGEGGGWLVQ